jgi:choline dehydrogenase
MSSSSFDYIIVGAGSAGCVLAARLSEDPSVSVVLIEAGKRDTNPFIHAPAGVAGLAVLGQANWKYNTTPQRELNARRGYQPRGKVLGGSSSINAMLYVRGQAEDYDQWAALGNAGWDYQSVLPFFIKSERNDTFRDELHGTEGPLGVSCPTHASDLNDRFIAACEANGVTRNDDYNGSNQAGAHILQRTIWDGERCSAAKAYLSPVLHRDNLTVLTNTLTHRVTLVDGQATGVVVSTKGHDRVIKATREVLLSAGAFGSPQLLQLSGIGDAEALAVHGISPQVELPGVGKNLQDHIDYVVDYRSSETHSSFGISIKGALQILGDTIKWVRKREGRITSSIAESGAFFSTETTTDRPDIQLIFVAGMVDDHARKLHLGHGFSCHTTVLRPHSRGTVSLASPDPKDSPLIDPQFLADPRDRQTMLDGARKMHEILASEALSPGREQLLYPIDYLNDTELMADIRSRADTQYHPVGTCKMGPSTDPMAVVDNQCRVYGVSGLRVVDASIMPTLVSGNTNAPTIMIAEKIVHDMKQSQIA